MQNPRSIATHLALAGALLNVALGAGACSASPTDPTALPPASGGSASGSGSGSGGGGGGGAPKPPSSGGAGPVLVLESGAGSGGVGNATGAKVCQSETHEGRRVPVDMYFLIDSSGSMAEQVAGGTKWQVVSNALVSFLEGPKNADLAAGVGYFPTSGSSGCSAGQPGCFCIPYLNSCYQNTGGSCVASEYRPEVPVALPANASQAIASIRAHQLSGGGTPTRPALEGAVDYLNQWATSHPERKAILVLATDGEPAGCDRNTPQDIADVAAKAWSGPNGIRTFVIGVGGSLSSLDVVAKAGGTDQALLVDPSGNLKMEFSAALDKIRGQSNSACDFVIPTTDDQGNPVNPSQVNVSSMPPGASGRTLVGQTFMGSPDNCGTAGGWFYDYPAAPKSIGLCAETCDALQGGSIQVEFGCDTVVQPPR